MPEHVRAFLIALGVAGQRHSGRTFLDHLEGTYQLLKEHGETIAVAGALHSIYGTQYYTPSNVPRRSQVQEVIGEEAERLVFLFCRLPRGQYDYLPAETARDLKLIQEANRKEQCSPR